MCAARGQISTIPVHNLLRLRTLDIDRFNQRKWLYTGKCKKQTTPCMKLSRTKTTLMTALMAKTPTQAESLLRSLEQAAGGIGLYVNVDKMEYMCFNQRDDIFSVNSGSLKLVDKFTYLGSGILSPKNDNTQQAKS